MIFLNDNEKSILLFFQLLRDNHYVKHEIRHVLDHDKKSITASAIFFWITPVKYFK